MMFDRGRLFAGLEHALNTERRPSTLTMLVCGGFPSRTCRDIVNGRFTVAVSERAPACLFQSSSILRSELAVEA